MANEKFFKIRWAGEGTPQIPHRAKGLTDGENPVRNVYSVGGSVIPLGWILDGGETGIEAANGGIALWSCLGGPGFTDPVNAQITWGGDSARQVWFEFMWEGDGLWAVLADLEALGWEIKLR